MPIKNSNLVTKSKNILGATIIYIKNHKKFVVLVVMALLVGGYFLFREKKVEVITYTTAAVSRGEIVASVTGDGQIAASQSVSLAPKASGTVTYVGVKEGQTVAAGAVVARIDATDAQKSVRDAQINLQSAELDLQRSRVSAGNTDESRIHAIQNAYRSLLNSNVEAYPSSDVNPSTQVEAPQISGNYILDKEGYIDVRVYPSQGGYSFRVSGLVTGTELVSTTSAKPLGSSGLYIKFTSIEKQSEVPWRITLPNAKASNYLSNYNSYQNLLAEQQQSGQQSVTADLDLQAKQIAVTQRKNALADAQRALGDYTVYAPFGGTVSELTVKKFDTVGSGTSLGTLIGRGLVAEVTMNEVDVARVAVGQSATMTFDAVDDFSLPGKVIAVDATGTVTSGVVNYGVTISLDNNDNRIKPGMSVSAVIVTDTKKDVLLVPNAAIKNQNGKNYVEVLIAPSGVAAVGMQRQNRPVGMNSRPAGGADSIAGGATSDTGGTARPTRPRPSMQNNQRMQVAGNTEVPQRVFVEVGISNETMTEVVSGLAEGQHVITRTTTESPDAKSNTNAAPSIFGAAGVRSGGSGGIRMQSGTGGR